MTEKPLDRLNYFNGQRLEASDLKTEQDYHIRVRRWLNKSLYSPGIARGLEVRAVKDEPAVMVSPGLALDAQGREIILWEQQKVKISSEARARPGNTEAEVEGLYLTIRYSEEVAAVENDGCEVVGGTTRGDHPAWGGPTRVRARAIFEQRDFLPPESSGEVVLALVELESHCSVVHQIDVGVRRYVGAVSAAKVKQYALEGEREVAAIPTKDPEKPTRVRTRVYFHIRGRQPNAVTLILRGDRLSPLHYTELGWHTHKADIKGGVDPHNITSAQTEHVHSLAGQLTGEESTVNADGSPWTHFDGVNTFTKHQHWIRGRLRHFDSGLVIGPGEIAHSALVYSEGRGAGSAVGTIGDGDDVNEPKIEILAGEHIHPLIGDTLPKGFSLSLTHTFNASGSTIEDTGAADAEQSGTVARTGNVMTFCQALEISIDEQPLTTAILEQIKSSASNADPQAWKSLGDGSSNHPFVLKGTGPIRLDFLPGVHFNEEMEHCIEFSVPLGPTGNANGGKVLYNLYVE